MIEIFSYEEMEHKKLPLDILEEMRHFGYARYDSFDGFDCLSIEMLDFENLLLSKGSVLFYLEKSCFYCFTSQKEEVSSFFREMDETITDARKMYLFLDESTKKDEVAFDALEKEVLLLEEGLLSKGKRDCVSEIIRMRKKLMVLKRYYEQVLNVLDILTENENEIFDEKTLRSFRVLERRIERRFQNVLNLRESVTQVRESYEAEVDISLNTTMKIFTVVTTIFLPLTLIAGWYGMNFDMPEYKWEHGYSVVCILSVIFLSAGILFFRKKNWF